MENHIHFPRFNALSDLDDCLFGLSLPRSVSMYLCLSVCHPVWAYLSVCRSPSVSLLACFYVSLSVYPSPSLSARRSVLSVALPVSLSLSLCLSLCLSLSLSVYLCDATASLSADLSPVLSLCLSVAICTQLKHTHAHTLWLFLSPSYSLTLPTSLPHPVSQCIWESLLILAKNGANSAAFCLKFSQFVCFLFELLLLLLPRLSSLCTYCKQDLLFKSILTVEWQLITPHRVDCGFYSQMKLHIASADAGTGVLKSPETVEKNLV